MYEVRPTKYVPSVTARLIAFISAMQSGPIFREFGTEAEGHEEKGTLSVDALLPRNISRTNTGPLFSGDAATSGCGSWKRAYTTRVS